LDAPGGVLCYRVNRIRGKAMMNFDLVVA